MSTRYSIAQARSSLPRIVDAVEAGFEVELTRRGKPVAAVISLQELARLRHHAVSFSTAYGKFLQQYSLREIGLEAGFFSRSRSHQPGRKVLL